MLSFVSSFFGLSRKTVDDLIDQLNIFINWFFPALYFWLVFVVWVILGTSRFYHFLLCHELERTWLKLWKLNNLRLAFVRRLGIFLIVILNENMVSFNVFFKIVLFHVYRQSLLSSSLWRFKLLFFFCRFLFQNFILFLFLYWPFRFIMTFINLNLLQLSFLCFKLRVFSSLRFFFILFYKSKMLCFII